MSFQAPRLAKKPFHESIVDAIRPHVPSRGISHYTHVVSLLRLIETTIVPADELPGLIKELEVIRNLDRRRLGPHINPVLRNLRRDHREAIR